MRQPANRTLFDLVYAHAGRPAVVCGGAPSLPSDLQRVYDSPTWSWAKFISANHHAFKATLEPRPWVDYIACCDNGPNDENRKLLRTFGRPIVSPRRWADFRVLAPTISNSAAVGVYVAWAMGCAPIIVCGVELYTGGTYFDDPEAESSGHTITLQQHLQRWSKLKHELSTAAIRVVSGPLLELFPAFDPAFDPAETTFEIASEKEIRRQVAGPIFEFTQDHADWQAGCLVEARPQEIREWTEKGYGRIYHGNRR